MRIVTPSMVVEVNRLCPGGVLLDVDLSKISQWKIGGYADLILQPASTEQVSSLLEWFGARGIRPIVIGLTSNLLFADEGLRAPVLQISQKMSATRVSGNEVWAEAGTWVPGFARKLMQSSLSGGEHICGIPGTLGGLICMNGGSQRKGIGDSVVSVESVDSCGNVHYRNVNACAFDYRRSVFQYSDEVITSAKFRFNAAAREQIRGEMRALLAARRAKFPRKEPNCGSVFKSNPAMYRQIGPPGLAIERLGFKGFRIGGAVVSTRHANFVVNTGDAKAEDVLKIIHKIGGAVEAATGYRMDVEVSYVAANGLISPTGAWKDTEFPYNFGA